MYEFFFVELYWVNKKSTGAQTTTASLVGYSGLIGRFTLPQGVTVPGHINLSADKVFVTYESQTYQEADDFEVRCHDVLSKITRIY